MPAGISWRILRSLIAELARHAGHADILVALLSTQRP